MKKIAVFLLCGLVCLSFVGCTNAGNSGPSSSVASKSATAVESKTAPMQSQTGKEQNLAGVSFDDVKDVIQSGLQAMGVTAEPENIEIVSEDDGFTVGAKISFDVMGKRLLADCFTFSEKSLAKTREWTLSFISKADDLHYFYYTTSSDPAFTVHDFIGNEGSDTNVDEK